VRTVLLMMFLIGTFTFEFMVTMPLMARYVFHADAGVNALLTSALGAGAVVGGLATAGRGRADIAGLSVAALGFGVCTALVGLAPTLPLAVAGMVATGVFSLRFTALCNTILQLESTPEMRTRVMALWAVAFMGSTFFGGPIIGWIGEHAGARWALGTGGAAGVVAAGIGMLALQAVARRTASTPAPATGVLRSADAERETS
jgi:MFS family permease